MSPSRSENDRPSLGIRTGPRSENAGRSLKKRASTLELREPPTHGKRYMAGYERRKFPFDSGLILRAVSKSRGNPVSFAVHRLENDVSTGFCSAAHA
jgi:hypothetical protein